MCGSCISYSKSWGRWFEGYLRMDRASGKCFAGLQRLEHPQILLSSGGLESIPQEYQLMTIYY